MKHSHGVVGRLVAVLGIIAGLAVGPATAAQASVVYCDSQVNVPMIAGTVAYEPGAGGSYKCYLFQGDGPDNGVKALQHAINVCYIDNGVIHVARLVEDGDFGSKTRAALVAVQNWYHIGADGNYGPQTHNAMNFPGTGLSAGECWAGSNSPW